MGIKFVPAAIALAVASFFVSGTARSQAVLTQHNDNQRTGANLQETVLTPSKVSSGAFGPLYSLTVDGQVPAQPLFVPGVATAPNSTKDLLYVATRTNKVYAFDVGTANLTPVQRQVWSVTLTDSRGFGAEELPGMDHRFPGDSRGLCLQSHGPVGIDSTPVIDAASNTMWVVYRTASPFAKAKYDAQFYIRKLDIRTGNTIAEQQIAPTDPQFDPNKVLTRPGLLLDNGVIYLGFAGAVCDTGAGDPNLPTKPHGWALAIDANTLALLAALNTTPNSILGGIWQSGYGLASDRSGFVYAFTGNNEGQTAGRLGSEKSEAILKLQLNRQARSFNVQYFTAPNWDRLDNGDSSRGFEGDTDLASAGPLILPSGYVAGGGKQGLVYVLNPGNMTQPQQSFQAFYNSWHSGISPCDYDLSQSKAPNIHGGLVVWSPAGANYSLVYGMAEKDYLKAYRVDASGRFDDRPIASTLDAGIRSPRGMPGAFLSLSANGGTNGILWTSVVRENSTDAINNDGSFLGRLMAFDAITLRKLWEASDSVSFAKFIPPTVAAGKVFRVAYQSQVVVYGLGTQSAPTHPPTLSAIRPMAAAWRNVDHLDLFMTSRDSADGSVLSTNWEARCSAPAGAARGWRGWFPIYSSLDPVQDDQPLPTGFQFAAAPGQTVTPVWRSPNHLDLFATGADGRVMSIVWEPPQGLNSGWQSWFAIGSATGAAMPGQPVTAVWRNSNHLDLFITDKNGRVMSTYFENNRWQPGWFAIAPATGQAAPGQPVTAMWRNANHLDLFITGKNGQILSTYFDNNAWQPGWFPVAPATGQAVPGQRVTAVWRNANHLDLFITGKNGQILSTYFENNAWQPGWFAVPPGTAQASPGQPVTAVWRNANHLDLFITGKNGQIMSTYFENNAWQRYWFAVAPATGQAAPGQPVTAVWSNANHLDLFITAIDGRVLSTYFDNNAWLGSWFSI